MSPLTTYTILALSGITLLSSSTLWAQAPNTAQPGTVTAGPRNRVPQDPAEALLVAYGLRTDAAREAERGNYNQALTKARRAERIMAIIVRDHPQWKASMMNHLRQQIATHIRSYEEAAARAPIPTGRQPGRPVPQEVNIDLPGIRANAEAREGVSPSGIPDANATDRELREELSRLRAECSNMARSILDLSERYRQTQQELITARQEQRDYRERYETLLREVTEERRLNNEVVESFARRLAEAEDRLRQSERAREEAETRANELASQLSQTRAELERVTRERDQLRAENEQLRAIVELNSPEKTRALLDQNLTLAEQLNAARARVEALEAQLAGNSDATDVLTQQLTEARSEVNELREQMSLVYDENRGYRRRISELTERLNNLEAELNNADDNPDVDPAIAEENRILREVIAKQRRTIQMQEEGRRLLIETYQQIRQGDGNVVAELERLEQESRLELTDEERRLVESIRSGATSTEQDADGTNAVRRSLEIQTLANLADKAFSRARYTSAEQLYRTLYEFQPDHVPGLVNLGTILLYRNKCEEATEYLTRATRLAPELPITYYLSGICYYRLDRMEEAERMFTRTIELDPANAEAFFYLANIEAISGRTREALTHFAASVKLQPNLHDAHYNMSRLYAEAGNIADAARAYDRAIQSGAEPDPDFENFLRTHPDAAKTPGADLIADVQPEEEAARLRAEDEEVQRIIADNAEPAAENTSSTTVETPAESTPTEATAPAEPTATPTEPTTATPETPVTAGQPASQNVAEEIARRQARRVPAAPTPSSAGRPGAVERRYTSVRVRTNAGGYRHRVRLRHRHPVPRRVRTRGTDDIRNTATAEDNEQERNERPRRRNRNRRN